MRYLVVGDVAVLASRGIERFEEAEISVSVVGVPDGASLSIQGPGLGRTYGITSGVTGIPCSDLKEGRYAVTVQWAETDPVSGDSISHEAIGNSFAVIQDEVGLAIIPAPLSSGGNIEHMWSGIVQTLEILLPLVDTLKNGNDVI